MEREKRPYLAPKFIFTVISLLLQSPTEWQQYQVGTEVLLDDVQHYPLGLFLCHL